MLVFRRTLAFLMAGLLASMTAGLAQAASLQVSPVRFELPNSEASKPLWVSNTGQAPIQVQVRVYKWDQANGEETLAPTTEVIATPAMTQVAPGGRQLVRIVRRGGAPASEQAYRLRVEELPSATPVLVMADQPALNLLLAYSLPVFLGPESTQPQPALKAEFREGKLWLTNTGTRRAMISDLKAKASNGTLETVRGGLVGYVLAGQTMSFPVEAPAGTAAFRATVNQSDEQDWLISR